MEGKKGKEEEGEKYANDPYPFLCCSKWTVSAEGPERQHGQFAKDFCLYAVKKSKQDPDIEK